MQCSAVQYSTGDQRLVKVVQLSSNCRDAGIRNCACARAILISETDLRKQKTLTKIKTIYNTCVNVFIHVVARIDKCDV